MLKSLAAVDRALLRAATVEINKLEKRVPAKYKLRAHQWLILHGRYVCKARKPDCPVCEIRSLCAYKAKTL